MWHYLLLLIVLISKVSSNLILDGTPTWQTNNWYTQVDGVMGGLSSGQLNFIDDNSILSFSGTISLDGGGFSSVRRRQFPVVVNLQQYSGIVVTLQSTSTTTLDNNSDDIKVPLGLHLQFHDTKDSFGYASAFAIPITKTQNEEIQIYLPLSSFDRGTRIGFQCTNNCQIDWSIINGMDIYVLFQEGNFQVKVDSIVAVVEDVQRSFDIPNVTFTNVNQLGNVIEKTIKNGGGLYDYDYKELCIAVYKSTLNTIVGSSSSEDTTNNEEEVVSKKIKSMICQGLQRADLQGNDKVNIAWTLRHTLDSVLEEIGRKTKVVDSSVWRPDMGDDTYLQCNGVTSGSSGAYNIISKSDSPTQMPSAVSTNTETTKPTIISTPLLPSSSTNRPSSTNPTIAGSTNDTTTTSMPTLVSTTTTYAPNPMLMISTSSSPTEVEVEEGGEVTPMLVENEVNADKAMLDTSASSSSTSKGSVGTVFVFFSVGLYAKLYVW